MSLTFKRELLRKILRGEKTQTRRLLNRKQLKVGSTYGIRDSLFELPKHRVLITRRYKQRLEDISMEEIQKEGFESYDEFRAFWTREIGSWNPHEVVMAYEFTLPPVRQQTKKQTSLQL